MPAKNRSASSPRTASRPAKDETPARATKKTTTARKATTRKPADEQATPERTRPRPRAREVAEMVAEELEELTGKEPESIVRLGRDDEGWVVAVEVVETRRIPDSTDILAIYEVHADDDGALRGYERTRRYTRGRTVDE